MPDPPSLLALRRRTIALDRTLRGLLGDRENRFARALAHDQLERAYDMILQARLSEAVGLVERSKAILRVVDSNVVSAPRRRGSSPNPR
jgi:hypothetical protein